MNFSSIFRLFKSLHSYLCHFSYVDHPEFLHSLLLFSLFLFSAGLLIFRPHFLALDVVRRYLYSVQGIFKQPQLIIIHQTTRGSCGRDKLVRFEVSAQRTKTVVSRFETISVQELLVLWK